VLVVDFDEHFPAGTWVCVKEVGLEYGLTAVCNGGAETSYIFAECLVGTGKSCGNLVCLL